MPTTPWPATDQALESWLTDADPELDTLLGEATALGIPQIQISPLQGRLLHILARSLGTRRILEIGTLAGYSTIWLARALPPSGQLLSLELDPGRAAIAQRNLAQSGLADRVQVRVGDALLTLDDLIARGAEPFDLAFIDADKEHCAEYLDRTTTLMRPGGLIIVDNVIRAGRVADPACEDPSVQGVRRMMESIRRDPRITATAIQTVGAKGHDGLLFAVVSERK